MEKVKRYICKKCDKNNIALNMDIIEPMTYDEMFEHLIDKHMPELYTKYIKTVIFETEYISDDGELVD